MTQKLENDHLDHSVSSQKRRFDTAAAKLALASFTYFKAGSETLSEVLWPTRCAICDTPGTLLCPRCQLNLPYLDHWRRCLRCGGPSGATQCSECTPVTLKNLGLTKLPFASCVSVVQHTPESARLITAYKDRNEQHLAEILACLMAQVIPPEWIRPEARKYISFIPATKNAVRRRGFDHAELLASHLASLLELPLIPLFARPENKDQRKLSRNERIRNMEDRFTLIQDDLPKAVLLVDDVYTTGSTLCSASRSLLTAGVNTVHCATFSRV